MARNQSNVKSGIQLPPPPTPIPFVHIARRSDVDPAYQSTGGALRFTLPDGSTIEVEAYVRPGHPVGLMVRGIDCWLDVEPNASNVVIVKPRVAR